MCYFIQALYLIFIFAFKIEFLWPMVKEQRWKSRWGSKGETLWAPLCAPEVEAFTILVLKHAKIARL